MRRGHDADGFAPFCGPPVPPQPRPMLCPQALVRERASPCRPSKSRRSRHFRQPLASQSHHRLPQLLQHQPDRLIAAQTEFALQTLGAQPCFLGARQPHCQKPTPQRYPRVVQDGSRRGRGLPLAGATEHRSSPGRPSLRGRAIRANEPHWPADTDQILATGLLAGKPFSELHQMLWKVVAQQSRSRRQQREV